MLAVKLHRKERPWLGAGSYLVPIFNWEVGELYVRKWIKVLNRSNQGRPNHHIRYMTQVRIPDDMPVCIREFTNQPHPSSNREFKPWCDIDEDLKKKIVDWDNPNIDQVLWFSRLQPAEEEPETRCPEIILGAPLASKHILWTKDLFLFYRD